MGRASAKTKYAAPFSDTRQAVEDIFVPAVVKALSLAKRGVITPGAPCAFLYPEPDDLGMLYQPAATGMSRWGRCTLQPVLFYGKDPRAGLTIQPLHKTVTERAEETDHPCSKPLSAAFWMVDRASLDGETVLDPFMGSGSFGVACATLGRAYIGIEVHEPYFDIACRRIEAAYRQPRLFDPPARAVQESLAV